MVNKTVGSRKVQQGGFPKLAREAFDGARIIVARWGDPLCAIVGPRDLAKLEAMPRDERGSGQAREAKGRGR